MSSIKEKAISVWNDHKVGIIIGGISVGALALSVLSYKEYKKGFLDGAVVSFWGTVDWLNETFPDTNIKGLVLEYQKNNPDKWVNYR